MAEIITIGEILVEMMAKNVGQTFEESGEFIGPYPSGAPAIFISQAAKVGSVCKMVSKVGNDGFGKLNIERLTNDGVKVSHIETLENKTTGIAFVTYKENGDRDFIFTTKGSACAKIKVDDVREDLFQGAKYFHIMGCSLFNDRMIDVFKKAIELAKANYVQISFDPNIRKEIMEDEKVKDAIHYILANCDIFLPGENELKWITEMETEELAVQSVLNQNAKYVVVKRGKDGSRVYTKSGSFDVEPIQVEEVDPTGAGDCFGGTLISLLNQGKTIKEAVEYANAAGAVAVLSKGPMEGTSTIKEIDAFLNAHRRNITKI